MRRFQLTPPELREDDVEQACLDLLRIRGYLVIRIHTGTFKSLDGRRWIRGAEKGTADYVAVHARHRGFLLETKRPSGELKAIQKFRAETILAGYGVETARARSARELLEWLEAHEAGMV